MPAVKLTALLGANIGRLLFIYYVVHLSYTPLLLALSFSIVTLITSGVKLWTGEGQQTASLELILFHAIDVIMFYVSISKVNPASYAVITLILFSITNVISSRSRSRLGALLFGIIGTMIFSFGAQISIAEIIIAATSVLIAHETRNLSTRTNQQNPANNPDLTEFGYAVLVICLTMLTSADERQLFKQNVTPDNSLLAFWALATLSQWICKRTDRQTTTQFTEMIIHTITAITVALVTLVGTHLIATLVSTSVLLMAAYCSIKSQTDDQLAVTENLPNKEKQHNSAVSYWTIALVVIASTLILSVHVTWFNARDFKPPKPFKNMTVDFNDRNMPAAQRNMYRLQCLQKTRSAYIELVMPHFHRGKNFTILDFPNHWNLGDAFIYVGQSLMFSVYGQVPRRPPLPHSALHNVPNGDGGVVFLHGGGNFGDIYLSSDNYRTRVTATLKDTTIVMLPQSVHYNDPNRLARMVKAYKHKDLTMMVRDFESQKYVQGNFTYARAPFVPDSAFMLGPQLPNTDPVVDILYLLRTDGEVAINYTENSPKALAQKYGLSAEVWDFPIHSFPLLEHKNKTVIQDMGYIYPGRLQYHKFVPSTEAITWYRTQIGNMMLSRGRVVIADRLHASIMATLIGRPVVYVDNTYRKTSRVRSSLSQFIPECTDAMLDAYYAPDIATAIKIAADLIKKMD